jgi:ABC-type Fe3+/spermidine/putrescine transport system ATPase subunit
MTEKLDHAVDLRNVRFRVGGFKLKDINLTIYDGEYFVILGPSGNGKSVLVKCIAGMYKIDQGEIWIGGTRRDHMPPEARDIGVVFQDQVLFPHMSVYDNVAFSLKLRKLKVQEIKERVEKIAELLKISYLLNRTTENLSGGETQRVALARAMIYHPKLLIMDEPYAAMDRNLADRLILEGKDLHNKVKQTTIHITHNQEEALSLADRICILENGRIVMIDTPDNVFRKPNSVFVAKFVCTENIYEDANIEKIDHNDHNYTKSSYRGKHIYSSEHGEYTGKVCICVRPEFTTLHKYNPGEGYLKNIFEGTVTSVYDKGSLFRVVVDIGFPIVNLTIRDKFYKMSIYPGDKVFISVDEDFVHFIYPHQSLIRELEQKVGISEAAVSSLL